MSILLALLYVLVGLSGAGVVFSRQPRRQVFAIGANGLVLALLFFALQAPDVAFAELAVGAAAVPALFAATLAAERADRTRE
jgi:energy-converting hydrogenase B subunit D